jgi:hypothetical protein
LIETNVIDGNVAETFTFSQAETLHLDFVAYTANQKRIKMPEGGSCKMEAWIDGTPATLYVQKTGTVNTTTRKATITLSRAESNMPVGDYLFTVKVFDSDDLLTGIIARGTMTALYSPQTDSVDYVGTSPAISAHASTHATGGSDPVTAADVDPAGTAIAAALALKADDNAVVKLTPTPSTVQTLNGGSGFTQLNITGESGYLAVGRTTSGGEAVHVVRDETAVGSWQVGILTTAKESEHSAYEIYRNETGNLFVGFWVSQVDKLCRAVYGLVAPIIKSAATTGLVVQNSVGTEKLKVGASTGADVQVTGTFSVSALPTYADEAAAVTGGLATGDIYKTATGELRVKL